MIIKSLLTLPKGVIGDLPGENISRLFVTWYFPIAYVYGRAHTMLRSVTGAKEWVNSATEWHRLIWNGIKTQKSSQDRFFAFVGLCCNIAMLRELQSPQDPSKGPTEGLLALHEQTQASCMMLHIPSLNLRFTVDGCDCQKQWPALGSQSLEQDMCAGLTHMADKQNSYD